MCVCCAPAGELYSACGSRDQLNMFINSNYVPSLDQAAAKAAKMPSSRANTAVDLMAVGG
jgi:hypothetical protein